jgi:hypothetical protein
VGIFAVQGGEDVKKYAVTGNAQPFMKIETGDKRFSISYFNWD